MDIRAARAEDVEGILPLVEKIAGLHEQWDPPRFAPLPDIQNRYRGWLAGRAVDPESVLLVAEQEGRIVAFLVATAESAIPIYRLRRFGFIHDVWVEPEYRNEGIARAMTLLALERFKAMGLSQVRLETAAANEAGRGLFAACGFRVSTQEMLCEL